MKVYKWVTKSDVAWDVMSAVEFVTGADWMEVISSNREEPLASIRQLCVNAMNHKGMSHGMIAKYIHRGRDMVSVYCSSHEDRLSVDKQYKLSWDELMEEMK